MKMMAGRAWPYQAHRKRGAPVAILVGVLAVVALITWTVVLIATSGGSGAGRCNTPADAAGFGEVLSSDALDETGPAPASAIKVRVLNGGGQRGQANLVASLLGDLGFTEAAPPANDPRYPSEDLTCRGQIRFGPAGSAAARTLSLVLPCTELVRDGRPDDTVDLGVGNAFGDVTPSASTRKLLEQLANPAPAENTGPGGETNVAAAVDPKLVEQAAAANTC